MGEGSVLQTNGNISPVKIHPEVSRDYGAALQDAAASSVTSMDLLHDSLRPCVDFLRAAGIGPVQMILSIKACTKEHARANQALGDEFAMGNANLLMEQIVKWAIAEYYEPGLETA
jgi:hypothetical protein